MGIHCGIYKTCYNMSNISYLNAPLGHSLWSSAPYSFSSYHFSIYLNVCTLVLYSPSHAHSPLPPCLTRTNPQTWLVPPSCSPILFKKKKKSWHFCLFIYLFIFIFLLFICAYSAWVISPPCPQPLPYYPLHPLLLPTPSIPGRNYFALISNFIEARV
jgi:hypothetical protein